MIFAIDAREAVGQRAGKGRFLIGILEGLSQLPDDGTRYILYSKEPLPAELTLPKHIEIVLLPKYKVPGLRPLWLARDLRRRKVDAFLAPTGFLPAILSPVPTAVIVYDLSVWRGAGHTFSVRFQEKTGLPAALRRAKRILTISEYTTKELQEFFPMSNERIQIAYGGISPSYRVFDSKGTDHKTLQAVRKKYELPEKFLLFVGTLEPRKNIVRLIEAYHRLPERLKDEIPLIVTGKKGWLYEEIFARVTELGEKNRVSFLGYVPDEDLPPLYNLCWAAAYPSLYEGFGLPALEALACAAPLVTSNTTSLPEVVGDMALTVNPESVEEIAEALETILTDKDLRARYQAGGPKQAARFTWIKTAEVVKRALTEIGN